MRSCVHAFIVLTPSRQGRIATAKKASATSIQAVYVPADDPMALAPATNFATWVLPVSTRRIAELGIHPAIDPLDSKSRMSDLRIVRISLSRDAKQAGHGTLQGCDCYTKDSPGLRRCFAAGKGTVLPYNQSHIDPSPSPRGRLHHARRVPARFCGVGCARDATLCLRL